MVEGDGVDDAQDGALDCFMRESHVQAVAVGTS